MKKNILTVDLEDWRQSALNPDSPISERVLENTRILLDLLSTHNARATFFCLGLVVEKHPDLIKNIHAAGHEIATHGWSHRSVKDLGKDKFKEELNRSVNLLQDLCGEKVLGHRAPNFSINPDMEWAFDIMRETGLLYDSSIFPIRGKRYGSSTSPVRPYYIKPGFLEVPLSTVELYGRRLPVLGGGYFRLYPYSLSSFFARIIMSENRPVVVYIHPYEIDTIDLKDGAIPLKMRIHQGLFRSRVRTRLQNLFSEFSFDSIGAFFDLK